jgi:hypothetical protein
VQPLSWSTVQTDINKSTNSSSCTGSCSGDTPSVRSTPRQRPHWTTTLTPDMVHRKYTCMQMKLASSLLLQRCKDNHEASQQQHGSNTSRILLCCTFVRAAARSAKDNPCRCTDHNNQPFTLTIPSSQSNRVQLCGITVFGTRSLLSQLTSLIRNGDTMHRTCTWMCISGLYKGCRHSAKKAAPCATCEKNHTGVVHGGWCICMPMHMHCTP